MRRDEDSTRVERCASRPPTVGSCFSSGGNSCDTVSQVKSTAVNGRRDFLRQQLYVSILCLCCLPPIPREEALDVLEAQQSEIFVAEPTDKDLLLPEATLVALRAGSSAGEPGEPGYIDALHGKGLLAVEKLSVKDCVQLLRR